MDGAISAAIAVRGLNAPDGRKRALYAAFAADDARFDGQDLVAQLRRDDALEQSVEPTRWALKPRRLRWR